MRRQGLILGIILLAVITVIPTLIVIPFAEAATENEHISIDESTEYVSASGENSDIMVEVLREATDQIESVPLEDYVALVVASEIPADFEMEALKAQALAARTYIVQRILHDDPEQEHHVTDTVEHQVFQSEDELREVWGVDYSGNMNKIDQAVQETAGEVITYDGSPITAAFFSTSNGYTENAEDYWQNEIPYLRSVSSPWDEQSPVYRDQEIFTYQEVLQQLGLEGNSFEVTNTTRTESNRIQEITVNGETFSGREIREKLDLRSNDFTIEAKADHIIFKTNGFGHGVGMSQYGANGMAQSGNTYHDIVKHYYQGVEIETLEHVL
ncbi:stage II sporulation protein D [Alkalibacillus silvisoli]|uniref:Stage II sporulation protein D n=1 Tax=Alkalibacillus silvisoli TaxID=392823 RepID=A0ABN1A696_9BACI